jgi:folate-dependent phosphoribosylglycinamide formyltransferase PurN
MNKLNIQRKFILFVSTDYLSLLITNLLVKQLLNLNIIPILINTKTYKNKNFIVTPPADISFFNVRIFEKNIIPFLNKYPTHKAQFRTYEQICDTHRLHHYKITDVNDKSYHALFEDKHNIVGTICIRQLQILEQDTIKKLTKNTFLWNLHGGLLPSYKGLLTPHRAIMNGEKNYGWTLHEINEGIDTGRIISTCQKPLDPQKPVLDTYLDMIEPSVTMIINALQKQLNGTIEEIKQPNIGGKYYSYPTPAEMEAYKKAGIRYIHSPKTYVDKIVSLFSNPDTSHGQGLKTEMINAITEHFRTERTAAPPAEKTARSA